MARARARGLDAQPRPRPRHLHHHQRARRREAAAARHRLPARSRANPRELLTLVALRRRVLRRADPRGRRRALVHPARRPAALDDVRRVRARASRSATSSAASAASSPAAATASRRRVPWAITFTDPFAAANVGTPLGVPLHPTQLYEAGAELLILVVLLATERQGPRVRRPDVLALHAALRDLALRHRVLSAATRAARVGMFSTSQFISVILAPLAIVHARLPVAAPASAGARRERARRAARRERRVSTSTVARRRARASASTASSSSVLPGPLALADPAADQGRPRPRRGRRRASRTSRCKAGQAVAVDVPEPADADAAARGAAAADPLSRTPTSSSSTSRPGWSCTRPPGTPSGTLVNALLHHVDDLSGIGGETAARHRAPARSRHVGPDGRRQARRGARGARAAVPRPRGREGIHRARVGRGAGGPPHRRADRPRPGEPARRCRRARAAAREAVTRIVRAEHLRGADARCRSRSTPAARTRSACT